MIKTANKEVEVTIQSNQIRKAQQKYPAAPAPLERPKPGWISREVINLPCTAGPVFTTTNKGNVRLARCSGSGWTFTVPTGESAPEAGERVTHWLPKPVAAHDGSDYE